MHKYKVGDIIEIDPWVWKNLPVASWATRKGLNRRFRYRIEDITLCEYKCEEYPECPGEVDLGIAKGCFGFTCSGENKYILNHPSKKTTLDTLLGLE